MKVNGTGNKGVGKRQDVRLCGLPQQEEHIFISAMLIRAPLKKEKEE